MKNKITSTTIRSHYVSARLTRNFDKTLNTFLIPSCRWQLFQIIPNKTMFIVSIVRNFFQSTFLFYIINKNLWFIFIFSLKILRSVLLTKFELPEVEVCSES